jgi:hypothetical protein
VSALIAGHIGAAEPRKIPTIAAPELPVKAPAA